MTTLLPGCLMNDLHTMKLKVICPEGEVETAFLELSFQSGLVLPRARLAQEEKATKFNARIRLQQTQRSEALERKIGPEFCLDEVNTPWQQPLNFVAFEVGFLNIYISRLLSQMGDLNSHESVTMATKRRSILRLFSAIKFPDRYLPRGPDLPSISEPRADSMSIQFITKVKGPHTKYFLSDIQ
ncbi:hypothetical protein CAPTEDRAFT_188288 [Capitella teleta]|uniref:Uncharacterized protein n=1 Tax=Capitella teleta TaxID=283909 RepID=R7TK31_CAPTE|nr:hypothetical protein CAPTEDRAFT_188288 [Capitella teleta]|eukprot:ELT91886.1 hypothetical protein CAPTEDRAFT_188288 [Capitella teleta]